ncbi:uncharacterized protein AMSG_07766 [Thecamonas trahens ATCC 50062]|uniref:Uncharacterized protein n=1 Tax=Thecamonas trahens ATCC 50062 TaxID=461836 RepID=A0A0L0DHX1_THETB|nr:hypothetical protein AMSG_07766 [Thecamonas trahens ATCC 50062]KNC51701.1 hypothetical protein AMSG_07766 [Thecamonas trahens ATCC 50062]|eukprot:XP_013755830.1 hypothetical protein AMSG_07766 [Thecamonas trahens ATCC 50062]
MEDNLGEADEAASEGVAVGGDDVGRGAADVIVWREGVEAVRQATELVRMGWSRARWGMFALAALAATMLATNRLAASAPARPAVATGATSRTGAEATPSEAPHVVDARSQGGVRAVQLLSGPLHPRDLPPLRDALAARGAGANELHLFVVQLAGRVVDPKDRAAVETAVFGGRSLGKYLPPNAFLVAAATSEALAAAEHPAVAWVALLPPHAKHMPDLVETIAAGAAPGVNILCATPDAGRELAAKLDARFGAGAHRGTGGPLAVKSVGSKSAVVTVTWTSSAPSKDQAAVLLDYLASAPLVEWIEPVQSVRTFASRPGQTGARARARDHFHPQTL